MTVHIYNYASRSLSTTEPVPAEMPFTIYAVGMPLQLLEVLSMVRLEPFVQAFFRFSINESGTMHAFSMMPDVRMHPNHITLYN